MARQNQENLEGEQMPTRELFLKKVTKYSFELILAEDKNGLIYSEILVNISPKVAYRLYDAGLAKFENGKDPRYEGRENLRNELKTVLENFAKKVDAIDNNDNLMFDIRLFSKQLLDKVDEFADSAKKSGDL